MFTMQYCKAGQNTLARLYLPLHVTDGCVCVCVLFVLRAEDQRHGEDSENKMSRGFTRRSEEVECLIAVWPDERPDVGPSLHKIHQKSCREISFFF